jgi:hypothetical protein
MMACVDPLNVKLNDSERRLVVDGLITNQSGPYQVKLFYSNKLNASNVSSFEPVTFAQVSIYDDLKNKFSLSEKAPGIYETSMNEFTGETGRAYYLSIKTNEGSEYESTTQPMTDPGEISNIYFEFQDEEEPEYTDALRVYIDSKGVLENDNLFRWRWTTIYKTDTNPELHTTDYRGAEIPAPEPCSGYIYRGGLIQVGDCTCCICWSYNYNDGAYVSRNDFVSDKQFNKQYLGSIPITSRHFSDRYYIEVQQLSLSEEAYTFWNLVEKQQKGSTDLFQPNAIKIRGNIMSLNNPEEEVLGFFGVSGVATRSLDIKKTEVPYELPPITDQVPYSCLDVLKNPTTEKPPFW